MADVNILEFNMRCLRALNLLPIYSKGGSAQAIIDVLFNVSLLPSSFGIFAGRRDDVTTLIEAITSSCVVFAMHFFFGCAYRNRAAIANLRRGLIELQAFGVPPESLRAVGNRAALHAKLAIAYGVFGGSLYVSIPMILDRSCEQAHRRKPCGFYTPMWFPFAFDAFPAYHLVLLNQIYLAYVSVLTVLAVYMAECSIVMHVVLHLRNLKAKLHGAFASGELRECIKYHQAIIEFSSELNGCFSSLTFMLAFMTSLIISALAFNITMVDSAFGAFQISLHLLGWLLQLFYFAHHGQRLHDESLSVSLELFNANWIESSTLAQKDLVFLMARSQRAVTLSTWPNGFLGLRTFISIMSRSYSYFAILANIK